MISKIKELFDFPQRLWPGKNTKIQGYGEKKAISGISSEGANGVYTLGKSQSSGPIPDLAKSEEATEFRAGQGVRLYGYGGIYTLERLPDEEEIPAVPQEAALQREIEVFQGNSRICMLYPKGNGLPDEEEASVFVIATKTVDIYDDGTRTHTESASGQIDSWGGNEPYPNSCPYIQSNVSGSGSGIPIDGSFEETRVVEMDRLYGPARSAMAINDSLSIDEDENNILGYYKPNWESLSNQINYSFGMPWSGYFLGYNLGDPEDLYYGAPNGTAFIYQVRYRLRNKGTVVLRVNHGFHVFNNLSVQVQSDDELFETVLYPGLVSPWFDSGIPSLDITKSKRPNIDRVRIGPYVNIP
jgi:hypothetical protein